MSAGGCKITRVKLAFGSTFGCIPLPAAIHPLALSSSRFKPGWVIKEEMPSGSTCTGQSSQIHAVRVEGSCQGLGRGGNGKLLMKGHNFFVEQDR